MATRPAATSTPSSFPRVDNVVQRARDDERREILGDELRIEMTTGELYAHDKGQVFTLHARALRAGACRPPCN